MSEIARQTPPRLRFSVAPEPSRLLRARERIRDYLSLHCGDREVVNDVVLAIEEACTNAIRHSGSPEDIEIVLSCARDDLTVKVKDKGRGFDVDSFDPSRVPDPLLDHGRGLFLISRLCDELRLCRDGGLEVEFRKHGAAMADIATAPHTIPTRVSDAVYDDSRHRSFLEEIDELFAALDWEFRYLYVNKRFCQITGRTSDELLGKTLWEAFPEVVGTDVEQRLDEAMHLGLPSRYEFYFPPLESWFEQRLYPTAYGINQFSIEINERKRNEAAHDSLVAELRQSEEGARVLAEVVEQANVPFAIRKPDGRLVRFNRAFAELTGYSRAELEEGCSALAIDITPPDWWEAERPLLAQAVAARRPVRYEKEYARKDGTRVPVEVFAQPLFDETGALVEYRSFLTDIGERKRAEEALRESEHRFRSLFEAMAEGVALHELVYAEDQPVDYRVIDVNSSFERQTGLAADDARGALASELYGTGEAPYLAEYARVAAGGSPYSFETYFAPMARHFRITAISPGPGRFATVFEDITERKRSEHEREGLLQKTALLLEAATAVTGWTDLDQMIESICDLLLRSTDHSRVVVELWDEDRREVEITASRGSGAIPRARFAFDVLSKTARDVITTRTTLVLDSAGSEMPAQHRQYADGHAFVLTLIVPIVHRERLIGLVTLDQPGERRTFEPHEVEVVEAIAGQAGAAISHARLYEEAGGAERLSAALNEINTLIHSTLRVEEIMERVVGRALEVIGSDSAMVALKHGDDWVAEYGHPEVPGVIHESVRSDEAPFMIAAVTQRRPIAIDDCESDPRCIPEVQRRFGVRSVLCLPLIAHDEALGVVFFNHHKAAVRFTEQTVDFAAKLAAAISSALENARLYEEQRSIATTLQANFIHPLPSVAGLELSTVSQTAFEPELVGGDFSDVFVLADGRVAILIGDVAGKGVRAAGLTETVRAKVRAFASIDPLPAFVLTKANDLMLRLDPDDPLVTAFYSQGRSVSDPQRGADEGAEVDGRGMPGAGVAETTGARVEHAHATLTVDDCLLLYTDGVTEARRNGELFGEQRLIETVRGQRGRSPQELAAAVRDAALGFAGQLKDDLQVVAVRLG